MISKTRSALSPLWRYSNEIIGELERWMQRQTPPKRAKLRYKEEDQVKLFRLRVWATRHRISVGEVLDMIMPVLLYKVNRENKAYGIGVSIQTLCGPGASRILDEEVRRRYPNRENISLWREVERETQLSNEGLEDMDDVPVRKGRVYQSPLDAPDIDQYTTQYRDRVLRERTEYRSATTQRWRRRKAYRNNPWR